MYEIYAKIIEFFAMIIMAVGFYYGYRLMKFIPKELNSLKLIVFALFFMILRRIATLISYENEGAVIVVSIISLTIATLAFFGFRRMYDNVRGR